MFIQKRRKIIESNESISTSWPVEALDISKSILFMRQMELNQFSWNMHLRLFNHPRHVFYFDIHV